MKRQSLIDVNPVKTMQQMNSSKSGNADVSQVLKKSVVLQPAFEQRHSVPTYSESLHAARKKRKAQKEMTAGPTWFNMSKGSLEENSNDLEIIRMRSHLGSILGKRQYYRSADRRGLPKYFQTGTVVETAADFYSARVPKKERKKTIVEELLADAEVRKKQETKYQVIADREMKRRRAAASRKMKRLKKNRRR